MELLILAIILIGLMCLSLRFGSDSRAVAYSKELEQARLGVVWEVEALRLAQLRQDAQLWRLQRSASTASIPATRRVRRTLAGGLRALAGRLSPELVAQSMVDLTPQRVAGC
jgi:hypothetical protein